MQTIEQQLEDDAQATIRSMIDINAAFIGHLAHSPEFAPRPMGTREDRLRSAIASAKATMVYAALLNEANDREEDCLDAIRHAKDLAPGQTFEHAGWRVVGMAGGARVEPLPVLAAINDREVDRRTDDQLERIGIGRLLEMIGLPIPGRNQVAASSQVPPQNGAAPVDPTAPG